MRVLLPDLPDFRELSDHGEHSVPGTQLDFYTREHVPGGDAEGVVLWFASPGARQELLARPGLQWVLTLTAGIDHVTEHLPPGVKLFNANRLHERAVAVHALAGMLAAARGLHRFRDAQARGEWTGISAAALPTSGLRSLDEAHVVLWGYGHIGRNLEELLTPFHVRLEGITTSTSPEKRDELLAWADWVILLLPSTPDTRGLVDAGVLSTLRPGAWLANLGRGNLVVTDDLVAALDGGHLGGAVLDVTDPEPLPPGHPLWTRENVILTPHVASTTADLVHRASRLTRDFLIDLMQGHEPEGLVESWRTY